MVLLLLTLCLLLLPLWESVIVLCIVVRCFMSIPVLQSSWWGRESWLLCLICLPGVSWWLSGSSSRCHGVVCSLWLWYFLIILTDYFSVSFFHVCLGLPVPRMPSICISYAVLIAPLERSTCPNHRSLLSLKMRSMSSSWSFASSSLDLTLATSSGLILQIWLIMALLLRCERWIYLIFNIYIFNASL